MSIRNLSRREVRLRESARCTFIRSNIPLTREERMEAEAQKIAAKVLTRQRFDERTAAARMVRPATRADLARLDRLFAVVSR